MLAFATYCSPRQRRHDADAPPHAGREIQHRWCQPDRRRIGMPGKTHQTGNRLYQRIVARHFRAQRSVAEGEPQDTIYHYLPPAIGCAAANYAGNEGHGLISALIVSAVLGYIVVVLKPFNGFKF